MKKKIFAIIAMSLFVAVPPVFAGHDHGSHSSMEHVTSESQQDGQAAKDDQMLVTSCLKQVNNIQRRIDKLQAGMSGKPIPASVRDNLKMLDQKLKEASEFAIYLQIF